MNLYSQYFILLGIAVSCIMSLPPFIWQWLARYWDIRFLQFGIFSIIPGKGIHSVSRKGTRYTLGFLPTGSYAKFFGVDSEDFTDIHESEYSQTLLKQAFHRRLIIYIVPFMVCFGAFFISAACIDLNLSVSENLNLVWEFIIQSTIDIFNNQFPAKPYFIQTKTQTFILRFSIICGILASGQILTMLNQISNNKIVQTMVTILSFVWFGFFCFLGYKIIVLSPISWTQIMAYIVSGLIGAYIGAALMYTARIITLSKEY